MVVLGGYSQEESAFWLVAALLEDTLFPYCGGKWQWGVRVEQGVLEQLVARKLPRLATHLASLRCDLAAITGHWLPSLLLAALPPATCVRVWDCVMVEGPKVLLRVGLALLKVYELTVTSVTSPDVLRKVLDLRVARSNDAEELLATAFRGIGSLSGTFVSGLRAS
ncbi:Rab-GAP TBC domain-containing protein, partial [Haematococcus lacustris]